MTEPASANTFAEPILQEGLDFRLPQENDPTPRYSASQLGGCVRKLFWKVQGVHQVENRAFENDCYMNVGNTIHDILQARIKIRYPDAQVELEMPDIMIEPGEVLDTIGEQPCFTEPVFCSGRPDIFVHCPYDENMSFVIEIKTGGPSLLTSALPRYHALQGGAYWRSTDVDWVYFYLVNRANMARTYRLLETPWVQWQEALRVINLVERHKNEVCEPPLAQSFISKHRHCMSCGYFYKCYPGG